jgi:hypothetical protein
MQRVRLIIFSVAVLAVGILASSASASPPIAITEGASDIGAPETAMGATVNAQGVTTGYHFEYGLTTSYGTNVPIPNGIATGTSDLKVGQWAVGLKPNTTYHFRIVASNSDGTTNGKDMTFITPEWGIQPTPEPIESKSAKLFAASCSGAEACVAVGGFTNSTGVREALIKVKSAGKWSLTPHPPGGSEYLYGVSCTSASACTAVGTYGGSPYAIRWNGTAWAYQSTLTVPGATENRFEDVSCAASNDCIAVGYSTKGGTDSTLAEHWNGTSWTLMSMPKIEGYTNANFYSLSCISVNDCWAVGSATSSEKMTGLAEHWDGTAWTVNLTPLTNQYLTEISCASTSSCLALSGTNLSKPLVARWNGSAWSTEYVALPEGAGSALLRGVSCTSASACTAVGVSATPAKLLVESWNGSNWSIQSTSAPIGKEAVFDDVSCASATDCTPVGSYFSGIRKTLVEVNH